MFLYILYVLIKRFQKSIASHIQLHILPWPSLHEYYISEWWGFSSYMSITVQEINWYHAGSIWISHKWLAGFHTSVSNAKLAFVWVLYINTLKEYCAFWVVVIETTFRSFSQIYTCNLHMHWVSTKTFPTICSIYVKKNQCLFCGLLCVHLLNCCYDLGT